MRHNLTPRTPLDALACRASAPQGSFDQSEWKAAMGDAHLLSNAQGADQTGDRMPAAIVIQRHALSPGRRLSCFARSRRRLGLGTFTSTPPSTAAPLRAPPLPPLRNDAVTRRPEGKEVD
jgi:hypothetical protein